MNTKPCLKRIKDVLGQLVMKAGRLLKRYLGKDHEINFKSEIDLVTEMDRAVESLFVKTIARVFPAHEVLSEEMIEGSGGEFLKKPALPGKIRWIIDPLDGTTNYAHGFPHFSVSAGIEYNGRIILGAVYNPMLQEYFFAERGKGAWRNGRPIHVSTVRNLRQALLATGFPYDLRTSRVNNFSEFEYLSHHCQAVRRAGSASLDLCDLACGRFDGFWEYKLKPWDVAAASLIIEEAGGRITNFSGRRLNIYGGSFLASNCILHRTLLKVLKTSQQAGSQYSVH